MKSILIESPMNRKKPKVHPSAFVAPTAVVIGDVEVESEVSIWFSAVLRADWGKIILGENTNCLDNCTIVAGPYSVVEIGENCIIGQNSCIIGPCHIGNNVSIGSNSTILPNSNKQNNCIIDANCVIPEGMRCKSKRRYGGAKQVEIIKVYFSELTVKRLVSRENSYYGENKVRYKELFEGNVLGNESEEMDPALKEKVKGMSFFKDSEFKKFFK